MGRVKDNHQQIKEPPQKLPQNSVFDLETMTWKTLDYCPNKKVPYINPPQSRPQKFHLPLPTPKSQELPEHIKNPIETMPKQLPIPQTPKLPKNYSLQTPATYESLLATKDPLLLFKKYALMKGLKFSFAFRAADKRYLTIVELNGTVTQELQDSEFLSKVLAVTQALQTVDNYFMSTWILHNHNFIKASIKKPPEEVTYKTLMETLNPVCLVQRYSEMTEMNFVVILKGKPGKFSTFFELGNSMSFFAHPVELVSSLQSAIGVLHQLEGYFTWKWVNSNIKHLNSD